jgi:hypothetical protein
MTYHGTRIAQHPVMKRFFVIVLAFALLPALTPRAVQADVPKAQLMLLARDFVARLKDKLPPETPAEKAENALPDDELLLVRPRIGPGLIVESDIGLIKRKSDLFISFRELMQGLSFPLSVNTETFTAQGWYIRENFTFAMDLKQRFVISRGQRYEVDEKEWFPEGGEIYINTKSISKWMAIQTEPKWNELVVDMSSDIPFPLLAQYTRRENKRLTTGARTDIPHLPVLGKDQKIIGVPSMDITINNRYSKKAGEFGEYKRSYFTSTAGDLMGFTTRSFSNISKEKGLESFRFTAERRAPEPTLLGPLQAEFYQFGDVSTVEQPLIGSGAQEWGVRITNAIDRDFSGQTSRTFEGDLAPDWDIELYNGNQLIAFQTVGPDGHYRFTDVDLFAGNNDFHFIFYGPQGEVREERVSIPIDLADIGRGGGQYDVSLSLNNHNTYDLERAENGDRNTPTLSFAYERGLWDGLSIKAGALTREANEKRKIFATGGVVARLGQTLLNSDFAIDELQEAALTTTLRRSFGKHDASLRNVFRTSRYSPENSDSEPTTQQSELNIRGPLLKIGTYELNYNNRSVFQETATGDYNLQNISNINTNFSGYSIGQNLDISRAYNDGNPQQNVVTTTDFRSSLGETRFGGSLGYKLLPEHEWQTLRLNMAQNLYENVQAETEVEAQLADDLTKITTSLNWSTDDFTISPRISYDSEHTVQASLSLRSGLAYNPYDKSVNFRRDGVTSKGMIRAFVYLDKDGNSLFDGTDEPLPKAMIRTVQIGRSAETDDKGVAVIDNLPEYELTDVVLDSASLDDPYYVPGFAGNSVFPRPGAPLKIDFPVHLSGEMDGYVYKPLRNGQKQPFSGASIQLVNQEGQVVMSSLTAFDGYYVISIIPPGTYILMIDPNNLKDSGFAQPIPRLVTIGYDGKVLAEQSIQLTKGHDVAVRFANTDSIKLDMGNYRSELLTEVIKLRAKLALQNAGISIPLEIIEDASKKDSGHYRLQSSVGPDLLSRARQICQTLSAQKLSCGMTLPAKLLFERNISASVKTGTQG